MAAVARARGKGSGRRGWRVLLGLGVCAVTLFLGASLFVEARYLNRITSVEAAPSASVAIVFGAGLSQGAPSPVLAERLDAALALYRKGKVQKLLLSGDNSDRYHEETKAMRRYVLARGVPPTDVESDWAGVSTYDTVVRAKELFAVREALLVTQRFHLPRALFIANSVGIDAHGVSADAEERAGSQYALRELVSRPLALAMVLTKAEPAYSAREQPR